ncbi:hypothetical protein AGMMS50276_29520 [Synergistales bacterium]|nr:hypothetical protein AGMMS50276_29520 [Synergistales bacterium]
MLGDFLWIAERGKFTGDCKSEHTRKAYSAALDRLEAWAKREKVNPLSMDYADGDNFIRALRVEGRAAASIRRDIDAVSAFYSWLERYHKTIKNQIRGTRLRPERTAARTLAIPIMAELKIILANANPIERAAISVMAYRGLRAGALPTLERHGERWTGNSKGKLIKENQIDGVTLPGVALEAIQAAGLDGKKPFGGLTTNAIEKRVRYLTGKLHDSKKISAAFSCHDFRHFYAVTEYRKNKDIFRLSKLLNHGGIQVTQNYLRSLGIEAEG